MNIAAMIPIKLNNERLPGKNTKPLGGKPLIAYCLETLNEISEIRGNIYVFCSDDKICEYLPSYAIFLKRPEYLDLPEANWNQFFGAFRSMINADIYISAHATAPFIKTDTIHAGLDAVLSGVYDSAFCAEKYQSFFWQNGKALNFDPSDMPRSQDIEPIYHETSGVYIFNDYIYDKYNRRIGDKPFIMEVSRKEAVDIDTEDDFYYAELMLNYNH